MPKKVRIPTPLRKLTNNEEVVEVNAANIGAVVGAFATWQRTFGRVRLTA